MIRSTLDHLNRKKYTEILPRISKPDGVIIGVLSLKYQAPKTTHLTPSARPGYFKELNIGINSQRITKHKPYL